MKEIDSSVEIRIPEVRRADQDRFRVGGLSHELLGRAERQGFDKPHTNQSRLQLNNFQILAPSQAVQISHFPHIGFDVRLG
jgi:hypothetical protein